MRRLIRVSQDLWSAEVKYSRALSDHSGMMKEHETDLKLLNKSIEECSVFLVRHGVIDDEIDVAMTFMLKNDHNVAEFGVRGSFILTKFEGTLN